MIDLTTNCKKLLEEFQTSRDNFLNSIKVDPINMEQASNIDVNVQALISFKDQIETLIEEIIHKNEAMDVLGELFAANQTINDTEEAYHCYKEGTITFDELRSRLGFGKVSKEASFDKDYNIPMEEDLNESRLKFIQVSNSQLIRLQLHYQAKTIYQ